MRECPESREKRPLKMAALYKRLTFELIFNLAITRSFLRATFNVIHMVPVIRILRTPITISQAEGAGALGGAVRFSSGGA